MPSKRSYILKTLEDYLFLWKSIFQHNTINSVYIHRLCLVVLYHILSLPILKKTALCGGDIFLDSDKNLSSMIVIFSATYLCDSNAMILNFLSAQSSMTEILLLNSVFYSGVSLFDSFQYFITKISTWSCTLKPLNISY